MDLDAVNLHFVDSMDEAEGLLRWLGERRPGPLALDTETTGLKWWTPHFLRLVQFGDERDGWAVDVRNWRGLIEIALQRYDGDWWFQNPKFDLHALESDDLPVPDWGRVHDVKTLYHLDDSSLPLGLKSIAGRTFGWDAVAGQDQLKEDKRRGKWSWETVPTDLPSYWAYGALDTVLTAGAAGGLMHSLSDPQVAAAYDREMHVQAVLYRAEQRGMRVDPTYAELLKNKWAIEAGELHEQLKAAGIPNPHSNALVTAALKSAGWEPEEFTPTGAAKLDKVVLAALRAEYGDIAEPLLRYRRLRKWSKTYLDTFLSDRDQNDLVHASINTLAARTGRMSVTGPALQTLPRGPEIRRAVLPYEGDVLYAIDYDSQEYRVFASYAAERALIEAFEQGLDVHRYTASVVYGTPYDQIEKSDPRRQISKNTGYGLAYGAGPAKIAETAGVPFEEAEAFISTMFDIYPNVKGFLDDVVQTAQFRLNSEGQGYVRTWGGRRVPMDDDKLYSGVNYLVQGSCADLLKEKIVLLDQAGYSDFIVLPVHDELLFSIPEHLDHAEIIRDIHHLMEDREAFAVPLTCETSGPMGRWSDKYE